MHGIVLKGLKDFVVERYGDDAWREIQQRSGNEYRLFLPVTDYPDEVVYDHLEAAVELTEVDQETLLYEFGRFLFPELVSVYGVLVDRDWTGLDLLVNVETYIHEALRAKRISEYTPPEIDSRKIDDGRVLVAYESDRGVCSLAEGIIVGVGEYYDEPFTVEERGCVHDGDPRCEFVVTTEAGTDDESVDASWNRSRNEPFDSW